MTTFYIIRHGESEFNIQRIMQGYSIDSPLTKQGKDQAGQVAKELSHLHFAKVFLSF